MHLERLPGQDYLECLFGLRHRKVVCHQSIDLILNPGILQQFYQVNPVLEPGIKAAGDDAVRPTDVPLGVDLQVGLGGYVTQKDRNTVRTSGMNALLLSVILG